MLLDLFYQMGGDINLLQLPRLCIWTGEEADGRIFSGGGPHLEQYRLAADSEYRLISRTSVFGACGRPLTAIRRIRDSDAFVIVGSSLLCILTEEEITECSVVAPSRVHSFTDEIVNVAYAIRREHHYELGLVLRSGRTLCVTASIDKDANRLRVVTVADYDRAKCGLLMSALCILPASTTKPWEQMRCVAGSAMGEVRLWATKGDSASTSASECGKIGFVISMAVVEQIDDRGEATVVAVTENRAINLWRIRCRESNWLQLLQKEEAAHAVRPSAVAYCSKLQRVVSAAEDGELCVWSLADGRFELLRRHQTRAGALRALQIDAAGRIIYGSASGSLFSLPISSLTEQASRVFIEGKTLRPHFRECDRTPIRSFAVIHHHHKYEGLRIAPGTRRTELSCLGEDGSTFAVTGDEVSEWVDNEGSFLHLNSWTDKDAAITVFHNESHISMSSFHPPDHLSGDNTGYTVLSERADRSTVLTARPTMSRGRGRSEPYVLIQSTGGAIALLRHHFGEIRIWRYRMPSETNEAGSTKRRQNQMMIVNTVAIDRSNGDMDTDLYVILGTTNGRILYGKLGDAEEVPPGENTIDFALDPQRLAHTLTLHPRSARLSKTSITQLEYCNQRGECTALSKNGWMMRMRVDGEAGKGLIVVEEDLSREIGVEWPVRIERRGEEEYVIGFNARNLVVVSRRLKTCLLSIDCGGGHRQVHVDLEGSEEGGGDEVERITVYYGKQQGIVRHTQRSLTAGLRQLAWTPHRDKIVYCTGVDQYMLIGSIDGEIVLGERRDYDSISVLQRWYVPETTACAVQRVDTGALRIVIGGPKGEVYVVDWSGEKKREEEMEGMRLSPRPLTAILTGNDSRIIDISIVGDTVVLAFADAQIAIFKLDTLNLQRSKQIGSWSMPLTSRSLYTKISVIPVDSSDSNPLRIRAASGAGTVTTLEFVTTTGKFTPSVDVSIDRTALTVLRTVPETGITVVGTDSGAVFVYKDSSDGFVLLDEWRDAHAAQITDLSVYRSPTGSLHIASVGMDCAITVLELTEKGKLSLVHSRIFAVNDPSSIHVLGCSSGLHRAVVAGCGMEIVEW